MFNVGDYTLAEHKVLWKDIATDFAAAVPEAGEPLPLPTHTVMLVAVSSQEEAHFVCGLLNSAPARALIGSYVATHISTHTPQIVRVPRFDGRDPALLALSAASLGCHQALAAGDAPDEAAVDTAAAQVWGLSDDQVAATRTFLGQLLKRDLPGR